MKYAADFRQIARNALRSKWLLAVLVGFVAMLLGGTGADGPEIKLTLDGSGVNANLQFADQTIFSTGGSINSEIGAFLVSSAVYITIAAILMAIVYFILGSIIGVGYAKFNLDLVDHRNAAIETLFQYFSYWKTAALAKFFQNLSVLLWTLLLIVPGIIASYSYAMTEFILADDPDLTAKAAIEQSKQLMSGNRWRLFCLHFSFLGWEILCTLTLGIGYLWLRPYKRAAEAAFYREISGTSSAEFALL